MRCRPLLVLAARRDWVGRWGSAGQMLIPQETLRKKNVLLVRGRFRPFTLLHNDMLQGAASQFFCEADGDVDPTVRLPPRGSDRCNSLRNICVAEVAPLRVSGSHHLPATMRPPNLVI